MRRISPPQKHSGFTTVELLAAIGVLALSAAILLPTATQPSRISLSTTGSSPSCEKIGAAEYYTAETAITGLNTGEVVLVSATQPGTRRVYGVTSQNRVVRINPVTCVATFQSRVSTGLADGKLRAIATLYNFYIDSAGLFENNASPYEKWVRSDVVNSFGNVWFVIHPNGDLFEYDGGDGSRNNLLINVGTNVYENPELLAGASDTRANNPQGAMNADRDRHFYRPSTGNFSYHASGQREKWIKGEIAKKSPGGQNNPWYFILPSGEVREWDGSENLSGALVGNFGRGVWDKPCLLYNANKYAPKTAGQSYSNGLDNTNGFYFYRSPNSVHNLYEDDLPGQDVKWFAGLHNRFFFIRTNGDVFRWDGGAGATGARLGNLGPEAWDNIDQIVSDDVAAASGDIRNQAIMFDYDRSLSRDSVDGDYYYNSFGLREKWLRCNPLAKRTGRTNAWVFILPNGNIVDWDGSGSPTGSVHPTAFPQAYRDPSWLCDAFADGTVLNSPKPDSFFPSAMTNTGDALVDAMADSRTPITAEFASVVKPNQLSISVNGGTPIQLDVLTGIVNVPPRERTAENTPPSAEEQQAAEVARQTVTYLNGLRAAKGLAPLAIDARLVAAAERKAKWMANESKGNDNGNLDLSPLMHIITFEGEQVGMNKWVREAGYPIPDAWPDNANFVESLYAEGNTGGIDITASGRNGIDAFTAEGPGGGHYDHIYSDNKHIGIGIALSADGTVAFLCYLITSPAS